MQTRAETIYQGLLEADPNNVDALARLAQIKRDAENLGEARLLLEAALREDSHRHPPEHKSQIRWMLCRNLAVVYWQISEADRLSVESVHLLDMAVTLSERAIGAAPTTRQRFGASMNLLHYLGALYVRAGAVDKQAVAKRARALLKRLRREMPDEVRPVAIMDILMRAELAFGTTAKARAVALAIVQQLKTKMSGVSGSAGFQRLTEEEQDDYLAAMDLLAGSEGSSPSQP
jgi:hypothetical protein